MIEIGLVLLSGVVRFVLIVPADDDDDADSVVASATAGETTASSVLDRVAVVNTSIVDPGVEVEAVSILDTGSSELGLESCWSG